MQAENFYTNDNENAISLRLISKDDLSGLNLIPTNLLEGLNFQAKSGEVAPLFDANGNIKEFLIGFGEDDGFLAKAIKKLPGGKYKILENVHEKIILSWSLEQYKFIKYKKNVEIARLLYLEPKTYKTIINKSQAIFLIRDLINTPTCDLGPEELANATRIISKKHSAKFTEIVGEDLLKKNYPAIYTVGQGSSSKPRLLSLCWGDTNNPKVTLVGKGVCFDSGGLNIKSTAGMNLMKKDMGGAAHVLGLADWIMSENIPINLQVLIPAVENSVDGNSYRPGDVITMRNGLTVEIENTDAEGRLVLADALCKACEDNPDLIIDFATLTGAARIAVGTDIAALFSNNDDLAANLHKAGNECSDLVWRLPLASQYNSLFDSDIADMANSGRSSYAGAIVAALFLQKYITKDIPWVHFDVMAWNVSSKPGKPAGGEALGFLAVAKYLKDRFA
jgi:leucyl aminopeptidase